MYKRYEKYKDSGVEWIGFFPHLWEIIKLRHLLTERDEINLGPETTNILSVLRNRGVINYDDKGDIGNKKSDDVERYKIVHINDIVINSMNVIIGSVGIAKEYGALSPVYIVLKPIDSSAINIFYYNYVFQVTTFQKSLVKIGKGILAHRMRIPMTLLKGELLPSPPISEQSYIANFLDQKTSEIDSLIADKEELIKKLEEYKQSIITEAVTKGLNPDEKMKDSGIEWIGEIPEHWEVKKLQYSGFCQNGVSKGADYFGKGYPFVSYGDVYNNLELPLLVEGLADANLSDRNLYSVCEGDIFFTRTSETIEEIGITSTCIKAIKDATFSGFLIRFRPIKGFFYKHFSKYYFRSYMHRRFFVKEMNLVTRASLSQGLLKRLPIISPPYKEQVLIADYLDELITEIDSSIYNINIQIDLVKSYRQSLIFEAVTGKIDVRDYQLERSEQFA